MPGATLFSSDCARPENRPNSANQFWHMYVRAVREYRRGACYFEPMLRIQSSFENVETVQIRGHPQNSGTAAWRILARPCWCPTNHLLISSPNPNTLALDQWEYPRVICRICNVRSILRGFASLVTSRSL